MKKGLNFILDTSKTGIDAIFKPWQFEVVNLLLEAHEEHSVNEMRTRLRARGHDLSRISVYSFLYGLSEKGIVMRREQNGRGRPKGIYQIVETRNELNNKLVTIFCLKMYEAFPEIEWLKTIWYVENA